MNELSQEIARLRFEGAHYARCALDAAALEEVVLFQKIVTGMAEAVWKRKHPDRERLPGKFEEVTRFAFRRIEDGSAVVPLEMSRNSNQLDWLPPPDEIIEAVKLAYGAFVAANRDAPLPESLPKAMLPSLAALGKKLPGGAEMQFAPYKEPQMTPVSSEARQRLKAMIGDSYTDKVEITGRVFEADVRRRQFQIRMSDKANACVEFTERQESEVTTALKEHASVQLLVKGQGRFNPDGVLRRIQNVEYLKLTPDSEAGFDTSAPPIEDVISEIFSKVPDQEWDKVPSDLSHRHDFYLYGIDKR